MSHDFDFNFHIGRKHALYRFARRTQVFMQDVGNKEDTELSREDLTLSWRELPVESLGHCQSVGN
jgi:hypothetical protein